MFAINGRFLARQLTGQERFAIEILKEIDKICKKNEFVLICPEYTENLPTYRNINVVKYGNIKKHFWEQISFCHYIKKNKLVGINLTSTCPIIKPDIVAIHDVSQDVNKKWYTKTMYGKLSTMWHKIISKAIFKKSKLVLTVSEFSRNEIFKVYPKTKANVEILGNGWNHIEKIDFDESALEKYNLTKKQYYFGASSITPQKNFKWIKEVARLNPSYKFVIAGKRVGLTNDKELIEMPKNLFFLGYITDQEMKTLMRDSIAFIHPALYEGFGVTPLEALACGANVLVSKISCLPEIYKNAVLYLDPFNYDLNLSQLDFSKTYGKDELLDKFQWSNMANKLYAILINYENGIYK